MHRTIGIRETQDEANWRLAAQARARGVQLFCYDLGRSVEYYATSTSRPGALHRVTLVSCDCPGFIRHQRCTHHARLLDEVGELPLTPSPPPAVYDTSIPGCPPEPAETAWIAIVCDCCAGSGLDAMKDRNGDWRDVTCPICAGRGTVAISIAVADLDRLEYFDRNKLRGVRCGACRGNGYTPMRTGGRLADWEPVECRACQGAGLVPVLASRPAPVALRSTARVADAA
jgi:hypothetical protein